ncbi:MFS transporter [Alicyclobacillus fastidiosus]|uniref:MFS transporter n=1 Tax=Alicyclobacillus fastidiosus TaxID=392011 RepID=A0ABY6ZJH3_9BACL|nr:MFS transporter [Alicyclobacillus fastidiosus]WAH43078.1 MFS transporter [Alicyclobacillus fastidiosus]
MANTEPSTIVRPSAVKRTNIRWIGGSLVLILCLCAYLDRAVFSVTASPIMKALHISPVQFGVLTTVFSVGYFIFQIPGSILVEKRGSRLMLTVSLVLWSIFTILTGAVGSLTGLIIVRFLFGLGEAPLFPAGNNFYANWFPKHERGRSNSLMNGGAFFSNVIGPPIIVAIVGAFGWRSPFYLCGLLGILCAVIWFITMRSKPEQHRMVNEQELAYIKDSNFENSQSEAPKGQWSMFLKQRSFWMIALGYFSTLWVVQFFVYWLPYYLQAARHISFKSMGFYTSVPWIAMTIAVLVAGTLSDALLKSGKSKYVSRNVVCVISLLISGIALVLSTVASSAIGNILWISLALGMAGFSQTLAWSISTDIGQQYTSTVGGWMNMWGFIAASIVPTLAPILAKNLGWNAVLLVNAGITVLGIIGYLAINSNKPLNIKM